MAKKTTKMLSSFMESVSPLAEFAVSYSYGDEDFEVQVKNHLTLDEKATFIERVVNHLFDDTDEYHPELRNAVFQITVLQMLTDLPVFTTKVSELDEDGNETDKKISVIDMEKTYHLCRCLNLRETVKDPVFCALYDELIHLVNEKIIFRQQRILMGEKKMLKRTMDEMETGLAMINSIGEQLNGTLQDTLQRGDIFHASNEFSERMKNMSDKTLLDTLFGR